MSRAVMISIQPKWCDLIVSGKKTIEVRKNMPKLKPPFKCYIYCSDGPMMYSQVVNYGRKRVIGEFVCDGIYAVLAHPAVFAGHATFFAKAIEDACLTQNEVEQYSGGKDVCGWHISDLVIYDKSKNLSEFYKNGTLGNEAFCESVYDGNRSYADYLFAHAIRRPPQSWCYVEELGGGADA